METKLSKYFKKTGETKLLFAEKVGINESSVYNLLTQKHIPSVVLAFKIEDATNGKVKAKDLYNEFKELPKAGNSGSTPKVPSRSKKNPVLVGNRRRKDDNIHKPNKGSLRSRVASGNSNAKKKSSKSSIKSIR